MTPSSLDLIDWPLAARVGAMVAGGGPETTPDVRATVRRDFNEFSKRSDDLVRAFTGLAPADEAPEPRLLGRAAWVRANVDGFRRLIAPFTEKVASSLPSGAAGKRLTGAALGVQVGVLLGYLAQKVLGQYDLVLGAESAGRVYFVGPNVIEAERRWNVPPRDFRFWITLHEITHRTQFTGVPWLADRVRGLIDRSLGSIDVDPQHLKHVVRRGKELLAGGPSAWRSATIVDLFLSEEQRDAFRETQALMTVVEGHGNFVMNRIGAEEIESFPALKQLMDARHSRTSPAERAFQRLIGLDMKYEQYSLGERFLNEVAEQAGVDAVNALWEREQNLPTPADLRDPAAWLERVRT